jgi:hypothetical protein
MTQIAFDPHDDDLQGSDGYFVIVVRSAMEYEITMESIYRICKEQRLTLEDNTVDFDIAKHSVTVRIGCYASGDTLKSKGGSDDDEVYNPNQDFYLEVSGPVNVTYVLRKVLRQYVIEGVGGFCKKESPATSFAAGSSMWTGISVKGLPDILKECIDKGFFVAPALE